jgi:hypothetical protein
MWQHKFLGQITDPARSLLPCTDGTQQADRGHVKTGGWIARASPSTTARVHARCPFDARRGHDVGGDAATQARTSNQRRQFVLGRAKMFWRKRKCSGGSIEASRPRRGGGCSHFPSLVVLPTCGRCRRENKGVGRFLQQPTAASWGAITHAGHRHSAAGSGIVEHPGVGTDALKAVDAGAGQALGDGSYLM